MTEVQFPALTPSYSNIFREMIRRFTNRTVRWSVDQDHDLTVSFFGVIHFTKINQNTLPLIGRHKGLKPAGRIAKMYRVPERDVYLTYLLDEVERAKQACASAEVKTPQLLNEYIKASDNLLQFVKLRAYLKLSDTNL